MSTAEGERAVAATPDLVERPGEGRARTRRWEGAAWSVKREERRVGGRMRLERERERKVLGASMRHGILAREARGTARSVSERRLRADNNTH
jgi:hypothetical protein